MSAAWATSSAMPLPAMPSSAGRHWRKHLDWWMREIADRPAASATSTGRNRPLDPKRSLMTSRPMTRWEIHPVHLQIGMVAAFKSEW
jgi:hypothetical protein